MPKIGDHPPNVLTPGQTQNALGQTRNGFRVSSLAEFLEYYQEAPGKHKLFSKEDVGKMKYWLLVRRGLIALGYLLKTSPLLPPGDTMGTKRRFFDVWFEEDPNGVECPDCSGNAVHHGFTQGPIWCPECGIVSVSDS